MKRGLLPYCLIAAFAAQALWQARDKSPTYDEPGHLTVSYLLAQTAATSYDIGHPPLLRYLFSIPLVALNPALPSQMPAPVVDDSVPLAQRPGSALYYFSTLFMFANRVQAQTLVFWPRVVSILLSCLLGFWIYKASSRFYGERAGLFSLALFGFCPNLLAHGSLGTTDAGGVAFAVYFLFALSLFLEKRTAGRRAWAGFGLGLAVSSKLTNVFLAPLALAAAAVDFALAPAEVKKDKRRLAIGYLKDFALIGLISWIILCACYKFENVFAAHTLLPEDWQGLGWGAAAQALYRIAPLPDSFLKGLAYSVIHETRGHGAFFMGEYSSFGWRHYFPVALLLKTPIATLLVIGAWIIMAARKKVAVTRREWVFILPVVFFLGAALFSKINIGLRHLLLLYPLFYILLGQLASVIPAKGLIAAGALAALETLSATPHYLAFFNRAAGGPGKGIDYLSDSNIDWGQDLKRLGQFLRKEGKPELLLSYFGTSVPLHYDIQYQALPTVWEFPKSEHINSAKPAKEYLAISVTNLQGTYFSKHDIYGWLKNKKPIARIGYSIYVYDVTHDLESQQKLLEIYQLSGDPQKTERAAQRILSITAVGS